MIYFVAPDFNSFVSGGNKFNRQIFMGLSENGNAIEVISLTSIQIDRLVKEDTILIDSIYLRDILIQPLINSVSRKIFLCHLLPSMLSNSGLDLEFEREIVRKFDLVIVNSKYTKEYLNIKHEYRHCKIVLPFIKPPVGYSRAKNTKDALMISNILHNKQIDKLIKAVSNRSDFDKRITIIGSITIDDEYFQKCLNLIILNNLQDKILLLGERDSVFIWKMLSESDVFIDVSAFETYGMAMAEAVMSEIPILTLGNGNVKNLVQESVICTDIDSLVDRIQNKKYAAHNRVTNEIISHWIEFTSQLDFI